MIDTIDPLLALLPSDTERLRYENLVRNLTTWRTLFAGRFGRERRDWSSSGWRGLVYHELVRPIRCYRLVHENTRFRHRVFAALGLSSSIINPDPIWILRKER